MQLWSRLERLMDTGLQAHAQTLDYLARRLISPIQQLQNKTTQINQLKHRMDIALQSILKSHQQHVLQLKNSLEQLSPQNVLARGYAMVLDETGAVIKNAQRLKINQSVNIKFEHGEARAEITGIK